MFDTTFIRVRSLTGHLRSLKEETGAVKLTPAEDEQSGERRELKPIKDMPCLRPEWWESHHYERR